LQLSGPKPEPASVGSSPVEAEARALPYQWNLLAWAALIGVLTGLAVVAFHELLGFINNGLFGPFVEGLLTVGRSQPPELAPELPLVVAPDAGTPLRALLQVGLGGLGFLPPPPAIPEPLPLPGSSLPGWISLWPVVVVPTLGGWAVGLLRRYGGDLGPGLPSLMAMADGAVSARPRLPFQRLLGASISLGSGASLGPEGPSVESGGNIGLWVALRGGLSPQSQKALVAAGVAAGLAAGFKAPIAGVFFFF
jgi:H+/Cl- antiporter ClcA